jgi:YidC/Oxa1 family membrane protein insertase
LPEIRNPNLQTQAPAAAAAAAAICAPPWAFALLLLVVLLGYQYFFKPKQPASRRPPQTRKRNRSNQPGSLARPQAAGQRGSRVGLRSAGFRAHAGHRRRARNRDHGRERAVQDRLHQSRRAGQALDPEEVLRHRRQAAGYGAAAGLARFGLPLSLFTYEPALTSQLNQALYQVTASGAQPRPPGMVLAPNQCAHLPLRGQRPGCGEDLPLRFELRDHVEAEVKRNGAPVRALVEWPAGLGDMEEFLPFVSTRPGAHLSQFAWSLDGKQDSSGCGQGQRQRHARPALPTRPSPISTSPRPFCPTIPTAPPSSRCTTPSTCPAT